MDRTFILFSKDDEIQGSYKLAFHGQNYVQRAFKGLSWADGYFALCSRDKKILVFEADKLVSGNTEPCVMSTTDSEPLQICYCHNRMNNNNMEYIFVVTSSLKISFYLFVPTR
ncbi:hypothetical protein RF11_05799 [Thelohanellus kitauei]|uniref:Uncharacterized protein n=1 Tax=Thelohanellus kitauei TaxID=669202 RepID=A0A0C2IW54_THEKT|nr:hypothetical protein RF11_05799 [Thelohanellus kitauei]